MSVSWSEESWRVHLPGVADPAAFVASLGASTIPLLAQASAERSPDKVALVIDSEAITHGELDASAACAAGWFAARFEPGSRVVLAGPSSLGFVRCYLGALRAGMVVVLANPSYTPAELDHLVADSGASLTLTDFDEPVGEPLAPVGGPDNVAVLAYTSGTTGKPKGVPLTHRNLLTSIRSAMAAWQWSEDDVLTHALPLFHQHGLSGVHATLIAGSSARIFSKFSDSLVESMRTASVLFAVPTIYSRLVSSPDAFEGLRLCVCGSAPLSTALAAQLPRVPLVRYGTTESGLDVSNPLSAPRADTVGIPLPGVHVRLADEEIQLRGPQVFAGYWGDAEDPFTPDGWLRTGDLGVIEDGHLVIRGRSKELIITGGMNVYPREVELALETHPAVVEAAVAGIPDSRWGEQVTAWAALREPADLRSHVRAVLAPYKIPKQVFEVRSLPRNHMGKIDRKRLVSPVQRATELGAFVSVSPPQDGIPVAVKDNIAADATVWKRLVAAGCFEAGRTTLPELAYSLVTPGCVNPWDPSRHAGGSSGGSAVAVAVGAVRYALGTDTGGSIRVPAALCGVAGLRPTYGALPMDGITPLAPSMDTVGPIALTAADCLWMFSAMGGSVAPVPARLKVGVNLQFCGPDVREVLLSAVAALPDVVEVEIPDARPAASSLMQSEARELYWDRRSEFSQQVVDVLTPSSPVVEFPSWPFPADLDAILLPVVPMTAAPLDASGLESKYFRFTALASITGYPALSVPAGLADGLPVGAQLLARPGSESILCRLGTMIEGTAAGSALANARADLVYQISPPR
ncbi:acyl-CoA synthetase (AMP-forming)/AMP-acid ligase II/Asp-tRNA(Asn)/Glu-tRNA(Gln) amidotransferase A subunit family amidase [Kibdelosporangium banguiense]|uniref:Acyl-CoA synthetase (AMP-forming)/AMP-acid ligase II/Asp-tRNA(Asn)/Glu-tRNA(Gln) amidotransferase A subunit family amidase n=1 Tax=Kibdelosporangium banguiense TaxID=1365924 RepID=A0ABS4TC50_9PSEU|nr:AMP-binding protein [Kibdelosporangium banguiense]MBP2321987.1 acyl-CoA synthetase (AMP-forming)/AMP-acid ligase II/Asp-tRNA(Asn)/Glu-tRNA(Gln) amidotransferase A subunit family amidase [Kibdelosporangium banguiense]